MVLPAAWTACRDASRTHCCCCSVRESYRCWLRLSTDGLGQSTTSEVTFPASVVKPLLQYWTTLNSAPRSVPAMTLSIQLAPTLTGVAPRAETTSACTGELKTRNGAPTQSAGLSSGCCAANG